MVKYFSDTEYGTFELYYINQMRNAEFAAKFPGVKGFKLDSFSMLVGCRKEFSLDKDAMPVTRKIEYKKFPSLHACNSKCMNGKVNGACECSCRGKNHGVGGLFNAGPFKKAA